MSLWREDKMKREKDLNTEGYVPVLTLWKGKVDDKEYYIYETGIPQTIVIDRLGKCYVVDTTKITFTEMVSVSNFPTGEEKPYNARIEY